MTEAFKINNVLSDTKLDISVNTKKAAAKTHRVASMDADFQSRSVMVKKMKQITLEDDNNKITNLIVNNTGGTFKASKSVMTKGQSLVEQLNFLGS